MVLIKRFFLLIPFLLVATSAAHAQDRCGTVQYENLLQGLNPSRKNTVQFEDWMKTKVTQARLMQKTAGRTASATYTIPVVVHVIHNGEAIGTALNISNAQIESQIAVLNEDFQRLNADASSTLPQFAAVAGDMDINFVLAKQDPNGLATTGIIRVSSPKTSWAITDNYQLKALSYWPSDKYLNIWVTNLSSTLLGYAQFPPTTGLTLQGLETNTSDAVTDGVVIDYQVFGKGSGFPLQTLYNKGRTTTHEVGHFLGLRHIWGDDSSCSTTTDYVDDTPRQNASTNGCPSSVPTSCSGESMYQNYMDYSGDNCMNIYTVKQIERMEIILNNSPRRMSLLTSSGATAPPLTDIGIKEISSPTEVSCNGVIAPTVIIKNFGTTSTITSATVQFLLNGGVVETKNVSLGTDETTVAFSSINFVQASSSQLTFKLLSNSDGNSVNDTFTKTVTVPAITDASLTEIFDTTPPQWTILNPDGLKTWESITANNGSANNKALYINLNNTTFDNDGTTDWLITPVMDFSQVNSALLKFDRAYALISGATDRLKILVSSNCGSNFSQATVIFDKLGSALSTVNSNNAFTPNGSAQWVTETISLQQFIGQSNIQLAFVLTNGVGRGNNIYLDNVLLTSDAFTDIALTSVTGLSQVICSNNPVPVIRVKNNGSSAVTSFNLDQTVNGTITTQAYTNLYILPTEEQSFTLNALTFNSGQNNVSITLKEPNGIAVDALPNNNTFTLTSAVNDSTDVIPLRQDFNTPFTDWTIVSQGNQRRWDVDNTIYGTSLYYRAFGYNVLGSESWLVSPVLDFSRAQEASLFFDVSYAKSTFGNDNFRIIASSDCGISYPEVLYERTGDMLSVSNYNLAWSPVLLSHWKKEYVNLSSLAGKQNIRLAFIATNDRGNNIYLDNLEFFTDANPNPPQIDAAYSIYSSNTDPSQVKVTFNLADRELAYIKVYSMMGQVVVDDALPETLNQTYTIDFSEHSTGIYIVQIQIKDIVKTQKVFVGR